jgi:S-adenosylmethionine synthetase
LSDNGQTGRKLVMDFDGPRIPVGGGALSGKQLTQEMNMDIMAVL